MINALKANELLYLSMLCGANEVFGIPDVFHGKTDDEIKSLIDETAKICLISDIPPAMAPMCSFCAESTLWVFLPHYRYP